MDSINDSISMERHHCNFSDCGKSFSRREHLLRHQLNHEPKKIYSCSYDDCKKTFVRFDLYNRHLERHKVKLKKKLADEQEKSGTAKYRWDPYQHASRKYRKYPHITKNEFIEKVSEENNLYSAASDHSDYSDYSNSGSESISFFGNKGKAFATHSEFVDWIFDGAPVESYDIPPSCSPPASSKPIRKVLSRQKHEDLISALPLHLQDISLMSRNSCNEYIAQYIELFETRLYAIPLETWEPNESPIPLLLMVIAFGSFKKNTELSTELGAIARELLQSSSNVESPLKVWVVQTLVLLSVYEKGYGRRDQHLWAEREHATIINLLHGGIIAEELEIYGEVFMHNISLVMYTVDSHHSMIFGHYPRTYVEELRVLLPRDNDNNSPCVTLHGGIKRLCQGLHVNTSYWGYRIMLYSVMQWAFEERNPTVKRKLVQAMNFLMTATTSFPTSESTFLEFTYLQLYLNLCTRPIKLQLLAGASFINGRPVESRDPEGMKRKSLEWLDSSESGVSLLCACKMIRLILQKHVKVLHLQMLGLAHASLIVWLYGYSTVLKTGVIPERPTGDFYHALYKYADFKSMEDADKVQFEPEFFWIQPLFELLEQKIGVHGWDILNDFKETLSRCMDKNLSLM